MEKFIQTVVEAFEMVQDVSKGVFHVLMFPVINEQPRAGERVCEPHPFRVNPAPIWFDLFPVGTLWINVVTHIYISANLNLETANKDSLKLLIPLKTKDKFIISCCFWSLRPQSQKVNTYLPPRLASARSLCTLCWAPLPPDQPRGDTGPGCTRRARPPALGQLLRLPLWKKHLS